MTSSYDTACASRGTLGPAPVVRSLAGILLLTAGVLKLVDPPSGEVISAALGILAGAEIVAGILMIGGLCVATCAWFGLGLAIAGVGHSMLSAVKCGCFGETLALSKSRHQLLASVLGLLCWAVLDRMRLARAHMMTVEPEVLRASR